MLTNRMIMDWHIFEILIDAKSKKPVPRTYVNTAATVARASIQKSTSINITQSTPVAIDHQHKHTRTPHTSTFREKQKNRKRTMNEAMKKCLPKMWAFKFCIKSQCFTLSKHTLSGLEKYCRSPLDGCSPHTTHTLTISRGVQINIQNESKKTHAMCVCDVSACLYAMHIRNNRIHCPMHCCVARWNKFDKKLKKKINEKYKLCRFNSFVSRWYILNINSFWIVFFSLFHLFVQITPFFFLWSLRRYRPNDTNTEHVCLWFYHLCSPRSARTSHLNEWRKSRS